MNWLRNRLRAWLGITKAEGELNDWIAKESNFHRRDWAVISEILKRIEAIESQPTLADVSRKQFEIENALREFKEVRDQVFDPKRVPIKTRNGSQMRQLMEQEL